MGVLGRFLVDYIDAWHWWLSCDVEPYASICKWSDFRTRTSFPPSFLCELLVWLKWLCRLVLVFPLQYVRRSKDAIATYYCLKPVLPSRRMRETIIFYPCLTVFVRDHETSDCFHVQQTHKKSPSLHLKKTIVLIEITAYCMVNHALLRRFQMHLLSRTMEQMINKQFLSLDEFRA